MEADLKQKQTHKFILKLIAFSAKYFIQTCNYLYYSITLRKKVLLIENTSLLILNTVMVALWLLQTLVRGMICLFFFRNSGKNTIETLV